MPENYISPLFGGALIGASAALLVLGAGRVAGISGILAGAAEQRGTERLWRLAFLAGLMLAPAVYLAASGGLAPDLSGMAPLRLVVAGLLVGFGSRLGAGCTSGHGVCGLARLSPRSFTAVAVFMAAAVVIAVLTG